jgi:hypothetical protein
VNALALLAAGMRVLAVVDRELGTETGPLREGDVGSEVMARMARNSVTASFLPEGRATALLSEIDA